MKAATQHIDIFGRPATVITRPRAVNKAAFDVLLEVDGTELEPTGDDGSDAPST